MRDILDEVGRWLDQGKAVAIAVVVQTWRSSPRGIGARMAFTAGGDIVGSVSGGCVEAAVLEAGKAVLRGEPARLLHFDVTDETAWGVGLTCGGGVDVFVSKLQADVIPALSVSLRGEESTVMLTVIRGPGNLPGRAVAFGAGGETAGSLGDQWDARARDLAVAGFESGRSGRLELEEGIELFQDVFLPAPTLIMLGGVHVAKALVPMAKTLGWRTVMIEPRKVWAGSERFAEVDQLLQMWPEEAFRQIRLGPASAVVTLTHDPKLDDAALSIALRSPAFYVGALGSAVSQARRRDRLMAAGLGEAELSRLHAPVGLEIGAQTPEEIGLAIAAEIVSAYRDRGRPSTEQPEEPGRAHVLRLKRDVVGSS